MGKVARRSFLKLMGAAPVAAPAAAKAGVLEFEEAWTGMPPRGVVGAEYGGSTGVNAMQCPSSPAYWGEELKHLLARRQHVEASEDNLQLDLMADLRIDGLRSVSAVNRARMIAEDRSRRSKLRELSWLDERIAEAKQKMGPLGGLL